MKTLITKLALQGFKSFNRRISLPFTNGFNVVCGPNGSGKCINGDSLVALSDGNLKKIQDIVETTLTVSSKIEKLDDGFISYENPFNFEIITLNPMTLKFEKQEVGAFVKRKSPDKLLRIKTRTGKELITTSYHPFFIVEDGMIYPASAEKLTRGQKIATPRVLPVEGEKVALDIFDHITDADNLYVPYSQEIENIVNSIKNDFGSFRSVSEKLKIPYNAIRGIKGRQSINVIHLTKILKAKGIDPKSFIKYVKSKNSNVKVKLQHELGEGLARFLGYLISEGSSLKHAGQLRFVNEDITLIEDFTKLTSDLWDLEVGKGNYKLKTVDLMIYSRPLQKIVEKLFGLKIGSNSGEKIIPPQIFTAPTNIVSNFLASLIDGDGYICTTVDEVGRHTAYVEYSTKSKKLAEGILTLLLRLNIISFLKEKENFKDGLKSKKEKYYSVIIYGIENLLRLRAFLPLRSKNKINKMDEITNWNIKPNPNVDLIPNSNGLIKKLVKALNINIKRVRKICPKLQAYYEERCEGSREGLNEIAQFIIENFYLTTEAQSILKTIILLANSDIFWDEIVEIETLDKKEQWVYDLSIGGYHNFIANNFVVHNSNLLDAICFVLGRTSAKSLRADRLHELIFHGADGKKPADFAAVTLYLDNSNKVFQGFEEPEVFITRKVNRKGVTVYKLNGRNTTREKVLQLLSSTRIYPEGHNIILQGDVTQIIEMNPVERRLIIDEISGIAEYNDKKEKANRDLEAVDAKLKEAEIIITQRYDIYKKLEEERNAAIRYQNLQKQLTTFKASFLNKKVQAIKEKIERTDEKLFEKQEQSKKLSEEIEKIEEDLEKKEASIREVADKLIDLSRRVRIEKEISDLRSQLLIKKDKIDTNLREIERLNNLIEKLEALESKKAELTGEIPRAVHAILKLNLRGVHGTVANLISVPEKYQVAVEVAAGPHLYDIVTEDEDVASYCIEYLKRERIGRATFLPLSKIKPILFKDNELLRKHGVVGVASKLIKYDSKFMSAIEFVFGNTLVVENLEIAKAVGIGKARMVTLDGDLVERSGAMVGGYYIKAHPKFIEAATKQEIERYTALRRQLESEVAVLKDDVLEIEKELKKRALAEEAKELIDLEKVRIASEREMDELRERRKKSQERKINLEIELNRLNIDKAKLEAELENVQKELQQYGEMHYIDEKLSALEEFIKKIEKELASIGLVNLKAIDEFEKFRAEFDEYKAKYEKILEEKKAVLEMIEKIEERRREVFYKCLNELSKEFNNIFVKMSGGTASLELENPQDLESGLVVRASPRGKTLLNIDAMSGGEKSLTALAFLFAIQKYKPAPFYVLDEVDAALDKENSKIVAELIKKLSRDNQFIVITHNDTTIRYGDRVYGCSMVSGESKIMGLELPKA